MTIQVIQYSNSSTATEKEGILYSPMSSPMALDDYDINIIDLSAKSMWRYNSNYPIGQVNSRADLLTIRQMVNKKKNSVVIYVFPQNLTYSYVEYSSTKSWPLKDIIKGIFEHSFEKVIPNTTLLPSIAFEKTYTSIQGKT